jgi:hypothetical protein
MSLYNELSFHGIGISSFDGVPFNVKRLDISNNLFSSLEGIPDIVEELRCSSNRIDMLKPLNNLNNLRSLGCSYTHIRNFEGLPNNVKKIVASFTLLDSLKGMPDDMDILYASYCKLTNVDYCKKVKNLDISANILETIDGLPDGIETLCISNNYTLRSVPKELPSTLKIFRCSGCINLPLKIYDILPDTIKLVECSKNNHENSMEILNLKSKGVEIIC